MPSLLLFNLENLEVSSIVVPDAGSYVRSVTVASDASVIVYCLQEGDAYNLRGIDFSQDPPVDVPLTDDGVSCDPAF